MPEEISREKRALDLSGEMPLIEGVETDEELLHARDLTGTFVKAVKAFRFYPADNPTLKGFQERLVKKFQFFLNKYHSFIFQIGEYDLSFKGKILYENRDVKISLAFLFYKDGLREIRFTKGLEDWEIQGLIEVIKRSDNINQLEDDLVTLLWEKDFIHIGYLATDEFLEETSVLVPQDVNQFRKNLVFSPVAHHVEADLFEEEGDEKFDLDEILSKQVDGPSLFVSNRSVYSLTPEEVEGLRKEVESEISPTFVFNIVDILFEILALEKEREPFQDAANFLMKVSDALLTLGQYQKAGDLLKRVYIILKTYQLTDWQTEIIQKLIIDAGEPKRIERIGRSLDKEVGIRSEELYGYLILLQRNAVKPLIEVLGELKNSKMRRAICDAIAEIGKNAVQLFTPFLDDRRWYLVRNITYILGRIGKEQTLPHIQKAFNHEDVRVRREAVQALGFVGGSKAVGLLAKTLTDEDFRIRAMGAINLAKVGKKAAVGPLLDVVQSKEFHKKEPGEIKAFFDAIGLAGSNEAIPVLRRLLERKGFLGWGKVDEIRIGAANALAMIGTPEAKAILQSGKDSKDELMRNACLQAMKLISPKEPMV